jgi:hypothetical protein
MLIEHRSSHLN